jgi:predicted AlkP superfamily phosphohydrolase/phosphomutase
MGRVVCIGLDGATFDLIDPWTVAGYLPALREITRGGSRAVLRSVILPFTPQAWTSFLTGVNPGIHGIFGFKETRKGTYGFQFVNNKSIRVKTLPTLLTELDKKAILVNIPMTYPPEPVNGVLISGMDAPGTESDFVYPPELRKEIFEVSPGYTIHLHIGAGYLDSDRKRRAGFRGLLEMVENRERAVLHLLKNHTWDFFAVNFAAIDQVQHHFWRYVREDGEFHDAVLKIYRRVDEALGKILSELDGETTLIVMSDHGAGPASEWVFFIDEWLRERGYLHFASRSSLRRALNRAVRFALGTLSKKLGSDTKDLLMKRFPGLRMTSQGFIRRSLIDWDKTKVFSGEHPSTIRINVKSREPQGTVNPGREERQICDRLIRELEELAIPGTDERLIEKVYRREELYHGPHTGLAPDLVVLTKDFSHQLRGGSYPPGLGYGEVISKKNHREFFVNGVHRLDGIFLAHGPNIVSGVDLGEPLSIMDIFPTVLFALGLEVPLGLDGKVTNALFEESFLRRNPVRYRECDLTRIRTGEARSYGTAEESKKIEEALRGLGYLD